MKHLKNNYDVNNIFSVHLACIVPNSATVISSFFFANLYLQKKLQLMCNKCALNIHIIFGW